MAKNTTATGSTIDGVTVVHPDNIGKGIKWDEATKKYVVNVKAGSGIVINDDGELEVKLSNDPSNLVRIEDDGLYYGMKAKPKLENLYVDAVNGVDQNPDEVQGAGTRDKPLKTVHYAVSLGEQGTERYVYLRCDQDHLVSAEKAQNLRSGVLRIYPYGDELDRIGSSDDTVALYQLVNEGLAPRLVFTGLRTWVNNNKTNGGYLYSCWHAKGTAVVMLGLEIINDLGMVLNPIENLRSDNLNPKEAARLRGSEWASYTIIVCKMKSKGTTVSNAGDGLISHTNGLNRCGFFHGRECAFTIFSVTNNLSQDCQCCIVPERGWNSPIAVSTSLNIRTLSEENQRFIGKATYDKVFDDVGNGKLLRVPNVDTKTAYFL